MLTTLAVLSLGKQLGIVHFPPLQADTFRRIWPLPIIYLGNMVTGLGGTKELSLPMFTALRRFSILMTMVAERLVLGVRAALSVKISVFAMVGGALIAAADDVTFTLKGYALVLVSDVFTASNGVFLKKKLDSKDLGKYGLMYYNSLFMFVPAIVIAWQTGDIDKSITFEDWNDSLFVLQFVMSCIMGFVLSYCVTLCTLFNGALTTTIIGCLKNISVTYLGMIIGGDYVFTWINFIGLNISVLGSIFYTYITFTKKHTVAYAPLKESPPVKVDIV
jgi:solute carrier family 35